MFDEETWRSLLGEFGMEVAQSLPRLGAALLLLVIGWIAAKACEFVASGLLRKIGLDKLSERVGAQGILDSLPHKTEASRLMARLLFFAILLVFAMAAVESLGLIGVTETLSQFVSYLPNVVAAAFIVLLGALGSSFVGEAVGVVASRHDPAGASLGVAVHYALLVVVAILALQRLGLDAELLVTLVVTSVAGLGLAMALAFGLGNRDLARNIMAGIHAKEEFEVDQHLRLEGREGRLVRIGSVKATFETKEGHISVPNRRLIEDDVLIVGPSRRRVDEVSEAR